MFCSNCGARINETKEDSVQNSPASPAPKDARRRKLAIVLVAAVLVAISVFAVARFVGNRANRANGAMPDLAEAAQKSWTAESFQSAMNLSETYDSDDAGDCGGRAADLNDYYDSDWTQLSFSPTDKSVSLLFELSSRSIPVYAALISDNALRKVDQTPYALGDDCTVVISHDAVSYGTDGTNQAVLSGQFGGERARRFYNFQHDDAFKLLADLGFEADKLDTTSETYASCSPMEAVATGTIETICAAQAPYGNRYEWMGTYRSGSELLYVRVEVDASGTFSSTFFDSDHPDQFDFQSGAPTIKVTVSPQQLDSVNMYGYRTSSSQISTISADGECTGTIVSTLGVSSDGALDATGATSATTSTGTSTTSSSAPSTSDTSATTDSTSTTDDASHAPFWGVWAIALHDQAKAQRCADEYTSETGIQATVFLTTDWSNLNSDPWYVVSIGTYPSREAAEQALPGIQAMGHEDAYVKYSGDYTR